MSQGLKRKKDGHQEAAAAADVTCPCYEDGVALQLLKRLKTGDKQR